MKEYYNGRAIDSVAHVSAASDPSYGVPVKNIDAQELQKEREVDFQVVAGVSEAGANGKTGGAAGQEAQARLTAKEKRKRDEKRKQELWALLDLIAQLELEIEQLTNEINELDQIMKGLRSAIDVISRGNFTVKDGKIDDPEVQKVIDDYNERNPDRKIDPSIMTPAEIEALLKADLDHCGDERNHKQDRKNEKQRIIDENKREIEKMQADIGITSADLETSRAIATERALLRTQNKAADKDLTSEGNSEPSNPFAIEENIATANIAKTSPKPENPFGDDFASLEVAITNDAASYSDEDVEAYQKDLAAAQATDNPIERLQQLQQLQNNNPELAAFIDVADPTVDALNDIVKEAQEQVDLAALNNTAQPAPKADQGYKIS